MNPRELILRTAAKFRQAGIPDPTEDSALLLSYLLHRPPLSLRVDDEQVLDDSTLEKYEKLASKRMTREPLQYLIQESVFYGRRYFVDPRVLIPRPETEWLCEWALDSIRQIRKPRMMDLCTGSGCIGITLKGERPDASVVMTDLSEDALTVAARNAAELRVRVSLIQSDLFDAVPREAYDLIISNPPYIPHEECAGLQPEVLFEPPVALDGGTDGLQLYRRLVADAPGYLCAGGLLMMELGAGQAEAVLSLMENAGFERVQIRKDLNGIDRMIQGVRR